MFALYIKASVAIKSKNIEFMSFFEIDRNVKRSHFLGFEFPRCYMRRRASTFSF